MNVIKEKDKQSLIDIQSFLIDQVDGRSLTECEDEGDEFQWHCLTKLTDIINHSRVVFFDDALFEPENKDVRDWFEDKYSGWDCGDLMEELSWRWTKEDVDFERQQIAELVYDDPESFDNYNWSKAQIEINQEYAATMEAKHADRS